MALTRIHLHWTAGSHKPSKSDLEHYHFVVDGDGVVHAGSKSPEANISTRDGNYVAHTRAANTGAIGIAICAMFDARERPFDAGKYPMLDVQVDEMCRLAARLAIKYDIKCSRATILTHAEIEPTLGVWQRGKWDITWLPGMEFPDDPIRVGDVLRDRIGKMMEMRCGDH